MLSNKIMPLTANLMKKLYLFSSNHLPVSVKCDNIMSEEGYKGGINMKIDDIRIREVRNMDGKLKAVVSITIDDCFVVHDIKIFEREEGYAIAMPSRKTTDGKYKDIAHPLNSETREMLQSIILSCYRKYLENNPD